MGANDGAEVCELVGLYIQKSIKNIDFTSEGQYRDDVLAVIRYTSVSLKSFNNKLYRNETELSKYLWKLKEKEVEHTINWRKLRQSNTCLTRSGLCNACLEEKVEILLSQARPSTQLNRKFEVSTCRHMSPPTSIAPTSDLMNTEPNRTTHMSEDHRRHRRMQNTVTHRAEVSVTLTTHTHTHIYIYTYMWVKCMCQEYVCVKSTTCMYIFTYNSKSLGVVQSLYFICTYMCVKCICQEYVCVKCTTRVYIYIIRSRWE